MIWPQPSQRVLSHADRADANKYRDELRESISARSQKFPKCGKKGHVSFTPNA
jgi:hypothetical protein